MHLINRFWGKSDTINYYICIIIHISYHQNDKSVRSRSYKTFIIFRFLLNKPHILIFDFIHTIDGRLKTQLKSTIYNDHNEKINFWNSNNHKHGSDKNLPIFHNCKICKTRNEKNYFYILEHIYCTNRNEIDILLILNSNVYSQHKNNNYLEFPNDSYCSHYNENYALLCLICTIYTRNSESILCHFRSCIFYNNHSEMSCLFYFGLYKFNIFHNKNNSYLHSQMNKGKYLFLGDIICIFNNNYNCFLFLCDTYFSKIHNGSNLQSSLHSINCI